MHEVKVEKLYLIRNMNKPLSGQFKMALNVYLDKRSAVVMPSMAKYQGMNNTTRTLYIRTSYFIVDGCRRQETPKKNPLEDKVRASKHVVE